MKALQIGDEIKKIEYSFEASLDKEFTRLLTDLLFDVVKTKNVAELTDSIVTTPDTVLTMFHAGLLEHHGQCGDGTVKSKEDAKKLLKAYLTDKTGEEQHTYYSMMSILLGQVAEDKFLDLLGVPMMFSPVKPEKKTTAKKTAKVESGVM